MRLGEMYTFPDDVAAQIRRYDPLLRVRWARQERCVRIERKVRRGRDVDPATCRALHDDYEAARDGYACVYKLHPHQARQVLPALVAGDLWRQGGARRVADSLDEDDRACDARLRRAVGNFTEDWARDLFRHINTPKTGQRPYRGTGRGQSLD